MLNLTKKLKALLVILVVCCITLSVKQSTELIWEQQATEADLIPLVVKGEIPSWLKGTFISNAPAILKSPQDSIKHWFDGLAMLQAFYIHDGKISYKSRFLHSEAYKRYQNSGKFDFNGFAQKSKTDKLSLIDYIFGIKNKQVNNANVNVASINKRLVAFTEIPLPVEFDADLNTVGIFNYDDNLTKNYAIESAHVLKDPITQDMWNYLIKIGIFNNYYQIYTIPHGTSTRKLIASIPVSAISYMHSFSLAGDYFILIDYPLRSKKARDVAKGFIEAFAWQETERSHVYVINKKTGKYRIFEAPAFFSFHHVNAFEENGNIFVDLITFDSDKIIKDLQHYPYLLGINSSKLIRLEINLSNHQTKILELLNNVEFPRIHDAFVGNKYKHFYAVNFTEKGNGLIKYTHQDIRSLYWLEEDCYANEPIFVPHPSNSSEDHGVILSIVNNLKTKKSFLLILNAKNFKEVARVEIPYLLPFGLHGQFFN